MTQTLTLINAASNSKKTLEVMPRELERVFFRAQPYHRANENDTMSAMIEYETATGGIKTVYSLLRAPVGVNFEGIGGGNVKVTTDIIEEASEGQAIFDLLHHFDPTRVTPSNQQLPGITPTRRFVDNVAKADLTSTIIDEAKKLLAESQFLEALALTSPKQSRAFGVLVAFGPGIVPNAPSESLSAKEISEGFVETIKGSVKKALSADSVEIAVSENHLLEGRVLITMHRLEALEEFDPFGKPVKFFLDEPEVTQMAGSSSMMLSLYHRFVLILPVTSTLTVENA